MEIKIFPEKLFPYEIWDGENVLARSDTKELAETWKRHLEAEYADAKK
jgi:hypothetical protein